MHTRKLIAASLLLISYAVAQNPAELLVSSRVSPERLRTTVRDLCNLGNRLGGTPSGTKSAAYAAKVFRSFGLKTVVLRDPERWTYETADWSLRISEPAHLRGLIQHDAVGGFSPTVPARTRRIVAVDKMQGIDRARIDSALVLVDGDVSDELYSAIANNGGAGVIAYSTVRSPAYTNWAMIQSLPEGDRNPIPLYCISSSAGVRLRNELKKGDPVRAKFSARTRIYRGQPETVVATLEGTSGDYVIVCAHGDSDSGGPGADDNASGVSGVLELARVYSGLISEGKLGRPRLGIRFIIWGSEYHSSEQYVLTHAGELPNIRAVINYDQIGTGRTRDCLYFEGNDVPFNAPLLKILQAVGEEYGGKKGSWKESTTNPSQGGTDSYVFLPAYLRKLNLTRVEIPSVTVFTAAWNEPHTVLQTAGWNSSGWRGPRDSVTIDYSLYYHSTLDIPALTTDKEPANMAWAVKGVGIGLLRFAW